MAEAGTPTKAKAPLVLHPVARCRWCSSKFAQVYGSQWVCLSTSCRQRQVDYGVRRTQVKRGESPFLYLPTPAQVELHECRVTNLLWGGAAGGSKSHGLRWGLYRNALTIPGYEALLLRRTFPELEKTHLRRMAREALLLGGDYIDSKRVIRFKNGSLIEAGHCENEDDAAKYLSSEYDEIAFDEATTFLPSVILEISSRARSSKPAVLQRGGAFVRMGSNPGGVGALFLRDFFISKTPDPEVFPRFRPDDYEFIPARLNDNPYLDADYVHRLEQLPDARQRQLRDGDWDVFEAQFFPEWRAEKDGQPWHVADLDAEAEGCPLIGGIDWGYNQPGCFGWYRVLPDGRLYKQADWKFQGLTVDRVASGILQRTDELRLPRFRAIYCDPSMGNKTGLGSGGQAQAESHAEVFGRLGLPMIRSDNDRYHGWQRVHDYLRPAPDGRPWLIVSPRCRYTIRTIPTLQQDKHDPDDLDTTQDDHACVAIGTQIATAGGCANIEDIKAGDSVWTRAGLRTVLWAGQTGIARRLVSVSTDDGRDLFCTPNHPIADDGANYIRADAIRYATIRVWASPTSTATPAPSGAGMWGRFRQAITSTISTAMSAITTSPIWRAGQRASTWFTTHASGLPTWHTLPGYGPLPSRGINQILAETGTDNTLCASGLAFRPTSRSRARRAATSSWTQHQADTLAFARTTASPSGGATSASITSPDPAPVAAPSSPAANTPTSATARVTAARIIDTNYDVPVYNLTVADCPEYFANGILTHNCDETRYVLAGRPAPGQISKPKPANVWGSLAWFKAKDQKSRKTLSVGVPRG